MESGSWSRTLQRLRHLHVENKGLKLLSLGLAILLFAVSRQPISEIHLHGAPIEFHGTPTGLEISGEVAQSVSLRLRGPRDVVRNLFPNQMAVIADLTNEEPGDRVIRFRLDDSSLPDNINLLAIEPPQLKVRLEPTARKIAPVEAQFIGQVAEGFEIYGVQLNPANVEIEGPQSLVNNTNLVITESISLSGRHEDFSVSAEIETPHKSLRIKTPRSVATLVQIGERRITRIVSNIPVRWLDPPAGGVALTRTITVELFGP
ncbi:MAG: CdaR family protein, partial [Blastocatellia bacterium]